MHTALRSAFVGLLALVTASPAVMADGPAAPAAVVGAIRGSEFVPRTLVAYPPFGDGRVPMYALETAIDPSGPPIACRDQGSRLLQGQRLISMLVPWNVGTYGAPALEHFRSTTYPQGVGRANFATEAYGVERLTTARLPEPSGSVRVLATGPVGRVAVDLDWPDGSSLHGQLDVVVCRR